MTLGIVHETGEILEETFEVAPEKYLETIDGFLKKQQESLEHVDRLLIVTGPGSFTASRVSVTIANTIAFALNIPVISLPNPNRLSMTDLCSQSKGMHPDVFAYPMYDRPPMTTN